MEEPAPAEESAAPAEEPEPAVDPVEETKKETKPES